jgi:hypothetical protein
MLDPSNETRTFSALFLTPFVASRYSVSSALDLNPFAFMAKSLVQELPRLTEKVGTSRNTCYSSALGSRGA